MTKAMEKEILKINDLSIAYNTPRGKLHAVRNVNLTVHEKEVVALIGESGCGKTTLCLSIVQLDEDNAQLLNGEINYYKNGQEKILTQMSERDIKI
ncbi:MAG: ATP-binding cassette domain-containing protein, partial [Halarsenatibacteraceae bacterium]